MRCAFAYVCGCAYVCVDVCGCVWMWVDVGGSGFQREGGGWVAAWMGKGCVSVWRFVVHTVQYNTSWAGTNGRGSCHVGER